MACTGLAGQAVAQDSVQPGPPAGSAQPPPSWTAPAPQTGPYPQAAPYPYPPPAAQPAPYPYAYPPPGHYAYPAPAPAAYQYPATPAPAPGSAPPSAEAEAARPEAESRFAFGALLGFTHISETNSSLSVSNPVLQGRVVLGRGILADVDAGFIVARDSDAGFTARTGNPWIKGWYRHEFGGVLMQGGLGVTIPLATVTLGPDGRLQRALYKHSEALWGMADIWRWSPGRLSVPMVVEATLPASQGQIYSAQLAMAPMTGMRSGESGTDLCAQLLVGGRFMLVPTFWMGARLQGVLLPSASIDRLQTAVAFRFEWTPRFGRFFLEGLMNLDEPVGVSGRGTGAWGIFLGKELAR
jgi:hypothetical protein